MAVTGHRTLEEGREVASLTSLLSPSEQGSPLETDERPSEHCCRQLLCSHGSSADASTNVPAEGTAPKQPGTSELPVPDLTRGRLSSHHCRAD